MWLVRNSKNILKRSDNPAGRRAAVLPTVGRGEEGKNRPVRGRCPRRSPPRGRFSACSAAPLGFVVPGPAEGFQAAAQAETAACLCRVPA